MNYRNISESDITIKQIGASIFNPKLVFINQNHSNTDFNYPAHSATGVHALSYGLFQASTHSAVEPFLHLLIGTDLPVYQNLLHIIHSSLYSYLSKLYLRLTILRYFLFQETTKTTF